MSENSFQNRSLTRSTATRWAIVVLLAILAGGLLVELGKDLLAQANAQETSDLAPAGPGSTNLPANNNIKVISYPIGRDGHGVILVDTQTKIMSLYQYQGKTLRWLASRNCTFDLLIEDYNTQISPREVKKLSEQAEPLTPHDN